MLQRALAGISQHEVCGCEVVGKLLTKRFSRPRGGEYLLLYSRNGGNVGQAHGFQCIGYAAEIHGGLAGLARKRLLNVQGLERIEVVGLTALESLPGQFTQ